jgi:hypothetical protein
MVQYLSRSRQYPAVGTNMGTVASPCFLSKKWDTRNAPMFHSCFIIFLTYFSRFTLLIHYNKDGRLFIWEGRNENFY